MKRILVILIIYFAGSYLTFGQHCYGENLIPNPSLDSFSICPDNVWQIDRAVPWTQPLWRSASSVYNQCMFDDISTQMDTTYWRHFNWRSQGMAWNIIWADDNWRVYIETPLKHQLEAGQCYYGEFYVLPSKFSYKVIDAIGIYFSDTLVKLLNYTVVGGDTLNWITPIYVTPQISNPTGHILKDTANWEKVSGTFMAQGTETAMIVGNFKYNSEIQWEILINYPAQSSRYFFDDFVLCKCEDTIPPAEPEAVVYIPNIFSPNGDGVNDVLHVRSEYIKEISFCIYNRWGEKVFESQNKNEGWDGNYKGKPCSPDVYVYHATIVFEDGTETSRKGNVTLVR